MLGIMANRKFRNSFKILVSDKLGTVTRAKCAMTQEVAKINELLKYRNKLTYITRMV
jgi:hypothetical protein